MEKEKLKTAPLPRVHEGESSRYIHILKDEVRLNLEPLTDTARMHIINVCLTHRRQARNIELRFPLIYTL